MLVLLLLLIWVIQTKAVIAASLVFFCILFFTFFRKILHALTSNRQLRLYVLTIAVLASLAVLFTVQNRSSFPHLFNTNTAKTRILIWENSNKMIQENFVLGVGAGNWKINFPIYGLQDFSENVQNGTTIYQRPHNDFLWVFAELGIAGFLVYVSIFLIIFYYLLRILKKAKERNEKIIFKL